MILEARNVHCHYEIRGGLLGRRKGAVHAVNGVSLQLNDGEALGIVGESGCGKSTLGRALVGLEPLQKGEVILQGEALNINHRHEEGKSARRNLQMIFQDPVTSLNPRLTIFETLSEPMLVHHLCTKTNARDRVAELLKKVELGSDLMDRYPHAFSGGQRQRISIARALSLNPKVLICDEVVSALDVSVQTQILQLLQKLKKEEGMSLIFISHDLAVVRQLCERLMVLYLGGVVEQGPSQEIFSSPRHPYTQALLDAIPSLDPNHPPKLLKGERPSAEELPLGCSFRGRCDLADETCLNTPNLKSSNHGWACHHPLTPVKRS
jgi:oligopeptide/dipeptide ABC transporter ATP-binding protein